MPGATAHTGAGDAMAAGVEFADLVVVAVAVVTVAAFARLAMWGDALVVRAAAVGRHRRGSLRWLAVALVVAAVGSLWQPDVRLGWLVGYVVLFSLLGFALGLVGGYGRRLWRRLRGSEDPFKGSGR